MKSSFQRGGAEKFLKSRAKRGNPIAARNFRVGNAVNLQALFIGNHLRAKTT